MNFEKDPKKTAELIEKMKSINIKESFKSIFSKIHNHYKHHGHEHSQKHSTHHRD